ncbi:MAG: SRPBCC family protein [Thermoleophilaceae bacterium]
MRQVTVDTVISAPREEIFDFIADLSLRPSFTDHYLKDFRLAGAKPVGVGASSRFLLDTRIFSERGGLTVVELERPRRMVEEGGVGRRGRSRMVAIYDLSPVAGGGTRVALTTYSEPGIWVDRLKQRGVHRWVRRQSKKSLERLKAIFEEPGRHEIKRVTVAGYESVKAPRFGAHIPIERKPAPADG